MDLTISDSAEVLSVKNMSRLRVTCSRPVTLSDLNLSPNLATSASPMRGDNCEVQVLCLENMLLRYSWATQGMFSCRSCNR